MKRISALGFSLSAVLLSHSAWAQDQVYCPEEVICSQSGPASSCSFEQHERGYWNAPLATNYPPSVLAGQYRLSFVSASYHEPGLSYPICVYTHSDVYSTLSLLGKPESNLERYDDASWWPEEFWWECKPTSAQSCPLFEQSAVFIQNKRQQSIIVSPKATRLAPNQYIRLFMDDFQDCADLNACLIEIYTEDEQIGGLTVDAEDRLKIVDIFSNIDVKSEIIKLGEFNAVEVR